MSFTVPAYRHAPDVPHLDLRSFLEAHEGEPASWSISEGHPHIIRIDGVPVDEVVAWAAQQGVALTPCTIELTAEESHRAWMEGYAERTARAEAGCASGGAE